MPTLWFCKFALDFLRPSGQELINAPLNTLIAPCHCDLCTANQKVIPATRYLRIGLNNNREHPVTPWYLSNHNRYMTATGHHHRCDLGLPSLSTLSISLQDQYHCQLSPFCHLPINSTELIHLWCLRFIFWYKVNNQENSVMVCFYYWKLANL